MIVAHCESAGATVFGEQTMLDMMAECADEAQFLALIRQYL